MAEVLGITTSIIALLQLTAKATSLSYDYIKSTKGASGSVKKFIAELENLTKVLNALQVFVSANPGSTTLDNLNGQDGPLQECTQELKDFLSILERKEDRFSAKIKKAFKQAKWPLKERETAGFISQMERHKTLLMLALSVDQSMAHSSNRQDERRTKALDWLYPEPFDKRHAEISDRRQKGTGQWMLETPEVQEWKKKDATSRLLWGHGIPGGGKTFLSSLMIDDLLNRARTEHCGVAYIYFNYKEQGQQKPVDVLASLVKQLACQMQNFPKEIGDLYEDLGRKQKKRPTFDDLYKVLVSVASSFPQTFMVFDALDECDQKTQRKRLLPLFHQMAKDGMSLFLTSRGHPEDVQHSFENSPKLNLYAKGEDIANYIQQKITDNHRAYRLVGEGKYKDLIISELKECANGMFLLVHFHIEYICQQTTLKQILAELAKLKGYSSGDHPMDPTYNQAMETLRTQPKNCAELALKVLTWLVKAKRVLTVRELQQAVSIEEDCTIYNESDLPDRKTLLDVCASLVTIDEKGDTVRLVHYTAQEYLVRISALPEGADLMLVVSCTTFLSFDVLVGACTDENSFEQRLSLYPFLDYSARQLSSHLKDCDEDLSTEPFLRFLRCKGSIDTYLQAFHYEQGYSSSYNRYPKEQTALHVGAVLGHCSVVRLLLGDVTIDINGRDSNQETALHFAASRGHESTVRLLLEKGADISAADGDGYTALHEAASGGHESTVRLLLEKGADISAADEDGYTALHFAASEGHESTVRLLLEKGADISATRKYRYTALHKAASRGHESTVRLLLEKGADISATRKYGYTALHFAASGGHESTVRLLLEKGADISAADGDGSTALHKAASGGHESTVRLLLEKGADISTTRKYGYTALHKAASGGHESTVRLLLEKGADISAVTNKEETALQVAIFNDKHKKLWENKEFKPIIKLLQTWTGRTEDKT